VDFAAIDRQGQTLDDFFVTDGGVEVFDYKRGHGGREREREGEREKGSEGSR
jgi:hypothetical protein